jgi:uncharacterized protein YjbJ (UPF0337 family)
MSDFLDKAKGLIDDNAAKAKDLLKDNADKVEGALDAVAGFVNDKTGKKHSDKIEQGTEKAKDAIAKFTDDGK